MLPNASTWLATCEHPSTERMGVGTSPSPGVAQAIESTRRPGGCDVTLPEGVWPGRTRHRRWLSWPIALASGVLAVIMGGVLVDPMMERHLATELPGVPPIPILNTFDNQTPVSVTVMADWQKARVTVPTYALRSDVTLKRAIDVTFKVDVTLGIAFATWRSSVARSPVSTGNYTDSWLGPASEPRERVIGRVLAWRADSRLAVTRVAIHGHSCRSRSRAFRHT